MKYQDVVTFLCNHNIIFEEVVVGRIVDGDGRIMTLRGLICSDGTYYREYGYCARETNYEPVAKMQFYSSREAARAHKLTVFEPWE